MVAFTFDALYFSFIVFISALIPGVAIGWPLLKKTGLDAVEKALLCLFIGLFAVPALLFIESLAGLEFSLSLVFLNIFLCVLIGVFLGVRIGAFDFSGAKLPAFDNSFFTLERAVAIAVPALLLLAMFLAFWIRIQPFSPIYSELDPYYYVYGSGQIIREGIEPSVDDTAWWPELKTSHLGQSLKKYLEAEWYSLYTNGGEYNNYLLFTTSSWLPPISAAFVSFGAYLLVSSVYGRRYGLFAAFLLAFLPITIYKMSAGVNEASPPGMMTLFMAAGILAYALVKNDNGMRILAGFAAFATITAGNYFMVFALPFTALLILQSIDYFVRGKPNRDFVITGAYVFAGIFAGMLLNAIYYRDPVGMLSGPFLMVAGSFAFSAIAYALLEPGGIPKFLRMGSSIKGFGLGDSGKRMKLVLAIVALALLAFFFTPAGHFVKNEVSGYVGVVDFRTALERTIAEQNLAGASFEGEAGFLALVPKNHVVAGASGLGIVANATYSALSVLAALFTLAGNAIFHAADLVFSTSLGIKQATGTKDDSLLFIFLVVSFAGLALRHFTRKGEERESPSLMIFLLALMFPVIYVGLNKIKFTIFVGVAISLAAAIALAELERLFRRLAAMAKIADGAKWVSAVFACLLIIVAYAHAAGPVPYAYLFAVKSLEPRYQDNPVAMMPTASKLCEELRAKGVQYSQMQPLCDAGAYANFSDSMNNQFDESVCWLSQMNTGDLFPPANDTSAQQRSSTAVTAAKFRCNRVADYWLDSMEWMGKNLNNSERVTSWWDYGHWINFFADKKTVLRNEQASRGMIGRVAHDYIVGSTQDLADSMNYFDSQYVLFDVELIGGSTFGGKYGALNYLGCVHEGTTSVDMQPGTSACEYDHSPERIAIPRVQTTANSCVISESQQRTGVYAYRVGQEAVDQSKPSYCVGETTIATGEKISATYYLDRKNANGDLVLSKGFIRPIDEQNDVTYAEMVYDNKKVWPGANGTLTDGMEDAKTGFYTSNLYRGFYLGELPGYDLVYKSKNGEVKIYRMKNFTGNKAGWIDPVESKREN